MKATPIQSKLNAIKKKKSVIKGIEDSLIKAKFELEHLEFTHWKLTMKEEERALKQENKQG